MFQQLIKTKESCSWGSQGLDLTDRVPDEPLMELRDLVHETVFKTIPKKKKMQKDKIVV